MAQKKVALACSVCGSRNYTIPANPNRTKRLELNKFCKYCGKYTLHKETRQTNDVRGYEFETLELL